MTAPDQASDRYPGQPPPGGAQPPPGGAGQDAALGAAEPDAELLRRHVDGDPDAFGVLFLRHRDRLWAVALRTLGDPEEAADALQDAMISAFRRADGFRGDSAVTTWLHRIVVNACLDRLRRRAARPVSARVEEEALDALAREPQVPDHGSDSDISMEVTAALRTLPEEQRAALVLVDMLGYPVADAAEALGVSAGTVKSRCARGRARLLPRLAHLRGDQRPDGQRPGTPQSGATVPATPPSTALPGTPGGAAAPEALTRPGDSPAAADGGERNPGRPGCVSPAERGGEGRS